MAAHSSGRSTGWGRADRYPHAVGLCAAAIVIAFLVAESAYRGEEAGRSEWIGAAAVLVSLPITLLAYRGLADATEGDALAVAVTVTVAAVAAIILVTALVSFGIASGRLGAGAVPAAGLTVVGGALLAVDMSASWTLRALIALSSPMAGILSWLVAKGLHGRRTQQLDPVHIGGFRPYAGQPVAGYRPVLRDQPSQPPRRMPPPPPGSR